MKHLVIIGFFILLSFNKLHAQSSDELLIEISGIQTRLNELNKEQDSLYKRLTIISQSSIKYGNDSVKIFRIDCSFASKVVRSIRETHSGNQVNYFFDNYFHEVLQDVHYESCMPFLAVLVDLERASPLFNFILNLETKIIPAETLQDFYNILDYLYGKDIAKFILQEKAKQLPVSNQNKKMLEEILHH